MKLGDRLREVRLQQGKTLLQIAETTKMSVSYLSDLERGRTRPSLDMLERLATYYGMTVVDLVANVDGLGIPSIENLAPGLKQLIVQRKISETEAQDLNRIEFRGKRPQTEEDWEDLYRLLRRVMKPYLLKGDASDLED